MIELDIAEQIAALRATFADIRSVVGVDKLTAEIAQLSEKAGAPDLWDDTEKAQRITSELSHKQAEIVKINSTESRLDDLEIMVELANEESDEVAAADVHAELKSVRIAHLPSGIVVSCQNEKSQIQNRAAALRVLQSRLLLLQREQEAAQKEEFAGVTRCAATCSRRTRW